MSFLSIKNITAGYDSKTPVIQSVSFTCEPGSITGILGANGSGKTTLIKAICGILPHQGNCILDEIILENLSARHLAKICSYIPQRSGISIDISVLDVVLMGFNTQLKLLEHPTASMYQSAIYALNLVGLSNKEQVNYLTLSEGQKQLCILARTLVTQGKLLLLDEPESALDFRYRYQILEILKQWLNKQKRSAIITLHDPELAMQYCDQLVLLNHGKNIGTLRPNIDSIQKMESSLKQIYGKISLIKCKDHQGTSHLVMLKEQEKTVWNL